MSQQATPLFAFLTRHYLAILLCILCFATFWRLYRLEEPKDYVFDEVYHAVTAKLIARNDPRAYEWWNEPVEPKTAVDWLHPPLAKYTQAAAMLVFGETPFGWRFSSAVFGVLVVAATAKLALVLFEHKPLSLLAAFLASLDGLLLVQSRVAMNDIHVTFFILLTLIVYVTYRKKQRQSAPRTLWWLMLTGLCAGLAMGTKWSGLFVLLLVWTFEALSILIQLQGRVLQKNSTLQKNAASRTDRASHKRSTASPSLRAPFTYFFQHIGARILPLVFLPFFIYVLSYSHMFLQGKTLFCEGNRPEQGKCYCRQDSSWWVNVLKDIAPARAGEWERLEARDPQAQLREGEDATHSVETQPQCKRLISHFSELHQQIWYYQNHLDATHAYQSRPVEWFLNLRPVWMHVQNFDDAKLTANVYSFGNTALFWIADIAVVVTCVVFISGALTFLSQDYQIYAQQRSRATSHLRLWTTLQTLSPLFFLLAAYFAVWLPWERSPRIMFFYHYTPAVPLLCILLAYWLTRLWGMKIWVTETPTPLQPLSSMNTQASLIQQSQDAQQSQHAQYFRSAQQPFATQIAVCIVLLLIVINYIVWLPQWTALPVTKEFADNIYFSVVRWR